MARFITVGYGDQAGYDRTPELVRKAAHVHDARLVAEGAVMGVARECVQVRNPENRGVVQTLGPYMRSELPVAGFALIEADSLDEAVLKVAQSPCAVAYGVVEVWALDAAGDAATQSKES